MKLFIQTLFIFCLNFSFLFLVEGNETEANFNFECENCNKEELNSIGKVTQKALNLKTCDIVSHKRNLKKGTLSDYWAQELIGSDLLREELEKVPAPNIENWIGVFDLDLDPWSEFIDVAKKYTDHNIKVKNLISDEGKHAILPELWDGKIPFLETSVNPKVIESLKPKDYLTYSFLSLFTEPVSLNLYSTVYPGDYLSLSFKRTRVPHYINNSINWFESEDIYEAFKKLSSSKVSSPVIVTSSENDFTERLDDMKKKA
ncbi:MAG: hypothetical protein OXC37_04350, partial [Bdellovibrionaceae bacterium]|nr:hypothetical protein [Pseudobdellovibrionaceae bacterium]